MNQQAIEAGALALDRLDYSTSCEGLPTDQDMAHTVLEAARPHIEAEFRQKIAQEIRAAKRTGLTRTEAYGWHNQAIENAARIAEGA